MILTREAQEKIVLEYSKEHTTKELLGFIDGINVTKSLMIKIRIDQKQKEHYEKLAKHYDSKFKSVGDQLNKPK